MLCARTRELEAEGSGLRSAMARCLRAWNRRGGEAEAKAARQRRREVGADAESGLSVSIAVVCEEESGVGVMNYDNDDGEMA